jgi:hypothetical protein
MDLLPEEQEAVERLERRCAATRERMLALSGDPAAKRALEENFAPLLRHGPLPEPYCRLPYDAPELLP